MRFSLIRLLYITFLVASLCALFRRPLQSAPVWICEHWDTATFVSPFSTFTYLIGYDEAPWERYLGPIVVDQRNVPTATFPHLLGIIAAFLVGLIFYMICAAITLYVWRKTALPFNEPLDWQI